jgi:hypothetical protein
MTAEIEDNLTKNSILRELLKEPLRFEEIIEKVINTAHTGRGTINKYLRELVDRDELVEQQISKKYGKRMPYQIVPSQQKIAEEIVQAYFRKQEIQNLLELANLDELNEITRFLFELPFLYYSSENPEPLFGYWNKTTMTSKINRMSIILFKLNTKKRIIKLKNIQASEQVIEIGNKMLKGVKISQIQNVLFTFYPIDSNEAQTTLNYLELKENKVDGLTGKESYKTNYQTLVSLDANLAELLAERCHLLVGRRPAKIS